MRCLARLTTILALLAAFTSPLSAQHADSSGAQFTIYVDSLDRAAFANIAELLQARVPGLHIVRTGDGGMRWYIRGPASVWEASPLVILDDVRMTVAGSSTPELRTRPAALDDINLDDVERIEVWNGAATSARFGPGSGNGVIRISTFASRAEPLTFRVSAVAGVLDQHASYPANFFRTGLDAAGRVVRCTLQTEANDACVPNGPPVSINVLENESPFERAMATRVAASVGAGTERRSWRGSATFDREGSPSDGRHDQRAHLRGDVRLQVAEQADVTVRAHGMLGHADLPAFDRTVLEQGLLARADTAWPGFVDPQFPSYDARRYGVSVNGRWLATQWLDVRLTSGVARMHDESDLQYEVPGNVSYPPWVRDTRGERRGRDLTLRLDAGTRYTRWAHLHATDVTLEHVISKREDEWDERLEQGDLFSYRRYWINRRTSIAGVALTHRVNIGPGLQLAGGVRLDQVRVGDVRLDAPPGRHVSLSWDAGHREKTSGARLRFRGALGDIANAPQSIAFLPLGVIGNPTERPKAEFTRERQAGVDAALLQDRVQASFTWYTKRTANVGNIAYVSGPRPIFERLEVLNRGVEVSLGARLIETPRFAWDARAWFAHNHNEVTQAVGSLIEVGVSPTRQWIFAGTPLGSYRVYRLAAVDDLDGDGLIDDYCLTTDGLCEATFSATPQFRPAFPPRSASLEMSFRYAGLTLSALVDHRGGHSRDNVTFRNRCFSRCQGLYDPSTSLRDQAEALLASSYVGTTVQDASFTKLREISLRVRAPAAWARTLGTSRLDISLAARNAATWTDYGGLDPEAISSHWLPLTSVDYAAPPIPRRLSLRVTATR